MNARASQFVQPGRGWKVRWLAAPALVLLAVAAAALAVPFVLYSLFSGGRLVLVGGVLCGVGAVGSLLLAERLRRPRRALPPLYPSDPLGDEPRVAGMVAGVLLYGFLAIVSLLLLFGAGLTGRSNDWVVVAAVVLPTPGLLVMAISYLVGRR